jgi:hypothetical protein
MSEIKRIEGILNKAKECIKDQDVIQSSEKIYKVVEECIKLLAEKNGLPEFREAKKEGRWWAHLLGRSSSTLSKRLRENRIHETWAIAYDLHVWGFHERKYGIEEVQRGLPYAEWILDYSKNHTEKY